MTGSTRWTAESLVALAALESRVAELKHRVLAHAVSVRVEEATGAATTATWLARTTHATVRSSRRAVHLPTGLASCEVLRLAYGAGQVCTEQAEVIARALEALPDDVPACTPRPKSPWSTWPGSTTPATFVCWVTTIDTGDRVAAATARRLACEAGIIPVVLGGKGEVLDVGRRRRLFTRAPRIALMVRDRGCTAAGCQTGPWFCHAHHDQPWALSGRTDLTNGRLLCPTHHHIAHDERYETRIRPDNRIEFALRC